MPFSVAYRPGPEQGSTRAATAARSPGSRNAPGPENAYWYDLVTRIPGAHASRGGGSQAPPAPGELAISAPGDEHEREADRLAERVVRTPEPEEEHRCACGGTCPRCRARAARRLGERLQARHAGPGRAGARIAPPRVHQALRAPGRPLEPAVRAFMEPRFGHDFGRVRIHTDREAAASARAVDALAYTVGRDVVFAAGRFAPGTPEGRRLLAHELAHVVQQDGTPRGILARQPVLVEPEPARVPEMVPEPMVEENLRGTGVRFNRPPANENVPFRAPANENAPGRPLTETVPGGGVGGNAAPQLPPSPYRDEGANTNWAAAFRHRDVQAQAASLRLRLESEPRAVPDPGGAPPEFVTPAAKLEIYYVTRTDRTVWDRLPKGSQIEYRPRLFHVLDAIDHDVARARGIDEDTALLLRYLPEVAPTDPDALSTAGGFIGPAYYKFPDGTIVIPRLPPGAAAGLPFVDLEKVPLRLRYETFLAARKRRAVVQRQARERAALAEAERVALGEGEREEGACSYRGGPHKGGNEAHNRYAVHVALVKGYGPVEGELIWTTPEGVSYSFDTFDPRKPDQVWEVKTRHEWASPLGMATAPYRVPNFENRFMDLEVQRLTGIYVASRCGLSFRYAVDNCEAYEGLRQQWALPPIEYIPFPGEPRQPCGG